MKKVKKVVALGITASLLGIAPASNAAVSGMSDIKPAGGVATKVVKKKVIKNSAAKVKYFKKYNVKSASKLTAGAAVEGTTPTTDSSASTTPGTTSPTTPGTTPGTTPVAGASALTAADLIKLIELITNLTKSQVPTTSIITTVSPSISNTASPTNTVTAPITNTNSATNTNSNSASSSASAPVTNNLTNNHQEHDND